MAKANKKARQMRDFELATVGFVYHPPKDVVDIVNKQKARRLSLVRKLIKGKAPTMRDEEKAIDIEMYGRKKKKDKRINKDQQIQNGKDTAKAWRPEHLIFSGGE